MRIRVGDVSDSFDENDWTVNIVRFRVLANLGLILVFGFIEVARNFAPISPVLILSIGRKVVKLSAFRLRQLELKVNFNSI